MAIHPLLAQIYETETVEDLEKTAGAEMLEELEKVAAARGIDLNDYTEDEIVEVLQAAMDEDDHTKTAEAEMGIPEDDMEKIAELDLSGRLMAHAFIDELNEIGGGGLEKEASAEEQFDAVALEMAEEILGAAEGVYGDYEKTAGMREMASAGKAKLLAMLAAAKSGGSSAASKVKEYGSSTRDLAKSIRRYKASGKQSKGALKRIRQGAVGAGVLAASAGGAAYGGHRMLKKSSVDEEALMNRAAEILDYNGYDVDVISDVLNSVE